MAYTELPEKLDGTSFTADEWNSYITENMEAGVPGLFTAKGDMAIAKGNHEAIVLGAGSNNQIIESDSNDDGGVKNSWAFVPVGGIIMWSGLLASLPSNWQLCDGTNGTPNLRNKFVIGAGGSFAVGANGGSATVNLQHDHNDITSGVNGAHQHTQGNTGAGSSHTHLFFTGAESATVPNASFVPTTDPAMTSNHGHHGSVGSEASHTHANPNTGYASDHSHTIALDDLLSSAQNILPPYYALAFIQRLS